MALVAGDRLGPYEVTALIGVGGMGEVYRAFDSRLNRDVAIKVSIEEFSDRFEREARAVAALNHPNICTLYDVGPNYDVSPDGKQFLVITTPQAEATASAPITVVLNWQAGLKK